MALRTITKTVEYDEDEDVYHVKSFSRGETYKVNRLKDNNHWFCTCPGYTFSTKKPKRCKHTDRIRVIDQLFKKIESSIKI